MKHIPTVCLFLVALLLAVGACVAYIDPTPTSPVPAELMALSAIVFLLALAHDQIGRAS